MSQDFPSVAEATFDAPLAKVWNAIVDPALVKQYMFGTDLNADWKQGGRITWSGVWEGKPYVDHGEVLEYEEQRRIKVSHYSPLSGQPETPDAYHYLSYILEPVGNGTKLTMIQEGNKSEQERDQYSKTWQGMLEEMRKLVEN